MAIKDWQSNKRIWNELVAVRDVRWQPDRARGPKLTLEVFDASGARRAKMWGPSEEQAQRVLAAQNAEPPVVRVSGTVAASGDWADELTVEGITPVEESDTEAQCFTVAAPLPEDHGARVRALDRLITTVRDRHLSALLSMTIAPGGRFRDDYLVATAAKKNHHAFTGGLLRHSVEVAEMALHAARQFPALHRDLLVTAALLHDIGKLWEMEQGDWRRGQYTEEGELLGHIFLGGSRLDWSCRTLKFPEPLRRALLHAILAHHEQREHGSPVTPLSAEAVALAKCDQISAELARYAEGNGRTWSWDTPPAVLSGAVPDLKAPGLDALLAGGPQEPLPDDPEERLVRRLMGDEPSDAAAAAPLPYEIAVSLPILGVVAAGDGIRSSSDVPEPERREVLPPPGGADFLLRVTGDSMIGAGIVEGDLLLVRRQETARVGEIVVAHVPGVGPVVKRLAQKPEGRFLQSENPAYDPLPVTDDVLVQGVVVRLERDM